METTHSTVPGAGVLHNCLTRDGQQFRIVVARHGRREIFVYDSAEPDRAAGQRRAGGRLPEFKRKALKMTGQFEIFRDGTRFWFRLTGEERAVLAVSGAFADSAQAAKAIMAVRENAAAGHIVDKSTTAPLAEPDPKTDSPLTRRAVRQQARPPRHTGVGRRW